MPADLPVVDGIQRNVHKVSTHTSILDVLLQKTFVLPLTSISLSVKLDDHNYLLWHEQFLCFIMGYRLERFINGSLSKP